MRISIFGYPHILSLSQGVSVSTIRMRYICESGTVEEDITDVIVFEVININMPRRTIMRYRNNSNVKIYLTTEDIPHMTEMIRVYTKSMTRGIEYRFFENRRGVELSTICIGV